MASEPHLRSMRCIHTNCYRKFSTYLTASKYGQDYFEATGKRTTNLASTNDTKVGASSRCRSPLWQSKYVWSNTWTERLADFAGFSANIERQISTLLAYRKSLIHECVTGGRRVTAADVARAVALRSAN